MEVDRFYEHLKLKNLSEVSQERYLYWIGKFFKDHGVITQENVNAFLSKTNNTVTRSAIKCYLEMLKNKDITIPKVSGRKKRPKISPITEEEFNAMRYYFYSDPNKILYGLMLDLTYECALRKQEVLNISLNDFQWLEWKNKKYMPCKLKIHGKGNRERFVIVSSNLMKLIAEYISNHNVPSSMIFKMKGKKWHDEFKKAVKYACGDQNKYSLHKLRHSRSTEWYKAGKDIIQIKNRLGHSDIATTQIYINPDEEKELENWMSE